jgi:predicted transcriptional regulator of viral defense system
MPRRGFFVIVPLEHSTSGAPPASWFVDELMKFHRAPYYVGLLSAAALHGAAHQQPQELQILTNLQLRPTAAGRVRLRFFKKKATSLTPIEEMRTQTGTMRVSTPEATALDLVRYETSLGGLSAVATVLSELVERIDAKRLLDAAKVEVELSVVQRTGYLLDRVGARKKTEALSRWLTTRRPHVVLLRPGKGPRRGKVVTRWAVIPNETIEVDQ